MRKRRVPSSLSAPSDGSVATRPLGHGDELSALPVHPGAHTTSAPVNAEEFVFQLAIDERFELVAAWRFNKHKVRWLSARELEAAGPGGKRLRRERRRRARALLLGALELRFALLRALPEFRDGLVFYGVPALSGIERGGAHIERVVKRATKLRLR